jgi:excisionase family DNA binding protein
MKEKMPKPKTLSNFTSIGNSITSLTTRNLQTISAERKRDVLAGNVIDKSEKSSGAKGRLESIPVERSFIPVAPVYSGPWSLIAAIEAHHGLMSVIELAVILRKTNFTVYRMVKKREIPFLRVGGSLCFDPAALARHYRRKSPQSAAAADEIVAKEAS